jgi:hypothetical protein
MTSLLVESLSRSSPLNLLTASQLPSQRAWLSPADPSINHNILRKAHNEGTAVWFFQDKIFIEWKSTSCLLWIHGKRTFLSEFLGRAPSDSDVVSGLWEKRHLVCLSFLAVCRDSLFASSSIIQDITVLCKLDQQSWHTFTSIPRISTNKHVTISCALSYISFPFALALAETFSTIYTRHTKMGLDSQVTTL